MAGKLLLGGASFDSGDYRRAIDVWEKVVQSLHGDLDRDRLRLPYLPAVLIRSFLPRALSDRGDFAQALVHGEDAYRIAEGLGVERGLSAALWSLGYLRGLKGGCSQAIGPLERGLGLERGRARSGPLLIAETLGSVLARSGCVGKGMALLLQTATTRKGLGASGQAGCIPPSSSIWARPTSRGPAGGRAGGGGAGPDGDTPTR